MIIMINSVVDLAGNLRPDGGQAEEVKATRRERREEESRRSEAAFQPAVTLMTPFITMCRLTSWQRHAAPDGGEGRGITPTLCLSFVEEVVEEEERGGGGGECREEVCGGGGGSGRGKEVASTCRTAWLTAAAAPSGRAALRPCASDRRAASTLARPCRRKGEKNLTSPWGDANLHDFN